MSDRATIAELEALIDAARAILLPARALLEADAQHSLAELGRLRSALMVALNRLQTFKHAVVFAPSIVAVGSDRARIARAIKADGIMMDERLAHYYARWGHGDIRHEWATYRREMLAMSDELLAHLDRERTTIARFLVD